MTSFGRHNVVMKILKFTPGKMLTSAKNYGIKCCYKCKKLFQYFLMRGQCRFYLGLLPKNSNLKMIQFRQNFGQF